MMPTLTVRATLSAFHYGKAGETAMAAGATVTMARMPGVVRETGGLRDMLTLRLGSEGVMPAAQQSGKHMHQLHQRVVMRPQGAIAVRMADVLVRRVAVVVVVPTAKPLQPGSAVGTQTALQLGRQDRPLLQPQLFGTVTVRKVVDMGVE